MKIFKLQNNLTVILSDGQVLTNNNCDTEFYNKVKEASSEDDVVNLLKPNYFKKKKEYEDYLEFISSLEDSEYLSVHGDIIYISSISNLSVPQTLAIKLWKAEQIDNQELIQTYLNFWRLCSLNPNSIARSNLFWFLQRNGMQLTKSGLFVSYRNANIKREGDDYDSNTVKLISDSYIKIKGWKKNPAKYVICVSEGEFKCIKESKTLKSDKVLGNLKELYEVSISEKEKGVVYTDQHSGRTEIKIGIMVSIPREECDESSDVTCSRGLHLGSKDWLSAGYYGHVGLMCMVNPKDVCAVPKSDNYGKLRTCAYFPIKIIDYDDKGKIEDEDIPDGFEDDFLLQQISYEGKINNEDTGNYKIEKPVFNNNDSNIIDSLSEIREQVKHRIIDERRRGLDE